LICAISSTSPVDKFPEKVSTLNHPIESYQFSLFFSKFRRMVLAHFANKKLTYQKKISSSIRNLSWDSNPWLLIFRKLHSLNKILLQNFFLLFRYPILISESRIKKSWKCDDIIKFCPYWNLNYSFWKEPNWPCQSNTIFLFLNRNSRGHFSKKKQMYNQTERLNSGIWTHR
jgi:hypothetical protein